MFVFIKRFFRAKSCHEEMLDPRHQSDMKRACRPDRWQLLVASRPRVFRAAGCYLMNNAILVTLDLLQVLCLVIVARAPRRACLYACNQGTADEGRDGGTELRIASGRPMSCPTQFVVEQDKLFTSVVGCLSGALDILAGFLKAKT